MSVEYRVRKSLRLARHYQTHFCETRFCYYEWFEHRGWFKPTAETMIWRARVIIEEKEQVINEYTQYLWFEKKEIACAKWENKKNNVEDSEKLKKHQRLYGSYLSTITSVQEQIDYFREKIEEYGGEAASDSLLN